MPSVCAAAGRKVIEADYFTEHTYHAQLEPLAAVAAVDTDGKGAEVWIGTQSQSLSLLAAVQTLETAPDRIRMNAILMGGGFWSADVLGARPAPPCADPVTRDQTSCQGHVDARGRCEEWLVPAGPGAEDTRASRR
jgi:xanthine dehydrogenase molybdopterin-binding subunit B